MYHYRTHAGAECDVVISKGIHPIACIEIKLDNAPHISEGNLQSMDDLRTKRNFVVVPDVDEFKTTNNIIVCNVGTFLSKYLPNLK